MHVLTISTITKAQLRTLHVRDQFRRCLRGNISPNIRTCQTERALIEFDTGHLKLLLRPFVSCLSQVLEWRERETMLLSSNFSTVNGRKGKIMSTKN